MAGKRKDYMRWEQLFMEVAKLAAKRSKDPSTQVGVCIVNDNKIISTGYNGFPNGCDDDNDFTWEKGEEWLNSKYPYVVHGELNAILNADSNSLKGATMYCTLAPCNECVKAIIQAGITTVKFISPFREDDYHAAAKALLTAAKINYYQVRD